MNMLSFGAKCGEGDMDTHQSSNATLGLCIALAALIEITPTSSKTPLLMFLWTRVATRCCSPLLATDVKIIGGPESHFGLRVRESVFVKAV